MRMHTEDHTSDRDRTLAMYVARVTAAAVTVALALVGIGLLDGIAKGICAVALALGFLVLVTLGMEGRDR